ncbi:hypothetical protein AAH450_08245 [Erwinia sp. P7711]|uniref:hypothetical protein n=1 Tax=Erwinia sp. P7711 TaxID=3141451 RepID=UPI003194A0AB
MLADSLPNSRIRKGASFAELFIWSGRRAEQKNAVNSSLRAAKRLPCRLAFAYQPSLPLKFSFARVERKTAKSKTIAKANTLFASELRRHRHGFWRDQIGYSSACGEHWKFNYNILCRGLHDAFSG